MRRVFAGTIFRCNGSRIVGLQTSELDASGWSDKGGQVNGAHPLFVPHDLCRWFRLSARIFHVARAADLDVIVPGCAIGSLVGPVN